MKNEQAPINGAEDMSNVEAAAGIAVLAASLAWEGVRHALASTRTFMHDRVTDFWEASGL